MGIEPFLVGSALDCVLAQRLARRLCPKCKEPYTPDPERDDGFALPLAGAASPLPTLLSAGGLLRCSKTGYKGRLALHEVMPVTSRSSGWPWSARQRTRSAVQRARRG